MNTTNMKKTKLILFGFLMSAATGGVLVSQCTAAQNLDTRGAADLKATTPRLLSQGSPVSFADLVEHVRPAVVSVVVERDGRPRIASDMDDLSAPFADRFRPFGQGPGFGFGQRGMPRETPTPRAEARGSGFIIESDGYIVTNNHVVEGAAKITIQLSDGRELQAKIVGTDKDTDIALLKADGGTNLPTVAFGDDSRMRVGDWVVAVGNPFGLGGTVTAGVLSSIHRDIGNGPYTDFLQIDAPINQGNSGGPTFDISGTVVGMNTAIFSPSGGSVGIGFAIPASTIKAIVAQLKEHGSVTRGWLGVQIQSLTPDLASSLGSADAKGAIVASLVDGSPAQKAGIKQGDVIAGLNGETILDSRDLTRRVGMMRAGSKAEFTIMRNGQKETISATIGRRDGQQVADASRSGSGNLPSGEDVLGMKLAPLTGEVREQFELDETATGVVVTSVERNSDAARKGLGAGHVIISVGGKDIRTPADIGRAVSEVKKAGRDSVLILVEGPEGKRFLTLKIA
jgi:serine protease Do